MAIILRPNNQINKFIRKAITTEDYKSFLQDFLRNRSETVKYEDEGLTIHIYAPELAYILTLNTEIQTDNYNNTNKEVINTTEYLGYFFDGFIDGMKKFQDEYKLSTDSIYSGNISDYIEDIKYHCFNKKIKLREYGWSFVRLQYPLTFKKDLLREYGFYSGLVRSVDELIENSPERFKELYVAKRNFENNFLTSDGIRPIATVASAFPTLNIPKFLNGNKEHYNLVMDIRRLINDDGKITSILNFKNKTKDIFDRIEVEQRKELFEYFKDSTINDLALKKGQKEAGTATYISNKKKKIGRTSIQSELKKTPIQNLITKIETLEAYLNWLNEYYEELPTLPPQQSTNENFSENKEPNDLTISTIEDWLFEFKQRDVLTEPHYTNLVNALSHYFKNGKFPKLNQTIKVGRVNKKLLGWHLNRVFHSEGKGVEIDLLSFAKTSISTFKDVEFDEKNIRNSNLYKYFTTKTK